MNFFKKILIIFFLLPIHLQQWWNLINQVTINRQPNVLDAELDLIIYWLNGWY